MALHQRFFEAAKLDMASAKVYPTKKLDDTKHLGLAYDRYICPQCLAITDPLKQGDIESTKRAEGIHTLTESNIETEPLFNSCF